MSERRRGRRMQLNAEINVVSLIDVILLLLIIFMITAPMMTGGLDLTLPSGRVQPMPSREAVVVALDRFGNVKVDGKAWSMMEFETGFGTYLRGRDDVTFAADSGINYGAIYRILAAITAAGVKSVGMAGLEDAARAGEPPRQ